MKIYISGKMGDIPENRIRHRFKEVADYLRQEGHVPVNPAVMLDNPGLEYEDYMSIDFSMLHVCDAIYMLEGWEESEGAKRELTYAINTGKKIIMEAPDKVALL